MSYSRENEIVPTIAGSFSIAHARRWRARVGRDARGDFAELAESDPNSAATMSVRFTPATGVCEPLWEYARQAQRRDGYKEVAASIRGDAREARLTFTHTDPAGPRQTLAIFRDTRYGALYFEYSAAVDRFESLRREALIAYSTVSLDDA